MKTSPIKLKIGFICGLSTFVDGVPELSAALRYIRLLVSLSDEIVWITASGLQLQSRITKNVIPVEISWNDVHEKPFFRQVLYHLSQQIRITLKLMRLRKVDIVIFAHGLDFYMLPILFARVFLGKKVVIKSDGRSSIAAMRYLGRGKKYKAIPIKIIEKISYLLANTIVVDSDHIVKVHNMQQYQDKLCIAASDSYVDTQMFIKSKELLEREYDVAYVGRFSRKKGFLEFLQSLTLFLSSKQLKVLIIGADQGDLQIQKLLDDVKTKRIAEVVGWIKPEILINYLNDIKILVIPSYEEGLPRTALEAMACGCIVLATPVGSLPAVVVDNCTGFIMRDNSPSQIAEAIKSALSYPDIESIAQNARLLIDKEYTFEIVVERWQHILQSLHCE